jgi:hypothetical protein
MFGCFRSVLIVIIKINGIIQVVCSRDLIVLSRNDKFDATEGTDICSRFLLLSSGFIRFVTYTKLLPC